MEEAVDLHIHSNKSCDGDFSPFQILRLAKEKGLRAISISDHDTLDAYPQALKIALELKIELVPSVELTTLFENREFHLLLPFVDWKSKKIKMLIREISKRRIEEAKERVKKLQELGFDISWKEVTERSGSNPPLGVTIAQIILEKAREKRDPFFSKYFEGKNAFFAPYLFYKDYFLEGKPAFVPRRHLQLLEVLKLVPDTGGVPVLAHPGAYFQKTQKDDLLILKENGLVGLEVYSSYHNPSLTDSYQRLAEELELIPTAGSDFHGKIKPHIPFGSVRNGGYWMVEELKKRRK